MSLLPADPAVMVETEVRFYILSLSLFFRKYTVEEKVTLLIESHYCGYRGLSRATRTLAKAAILKKSHYYCVQQIDHAIKAGAYTLS